MSTVVIISGLPTQVVDNRKPFASDGCTLAPDGWWNECCIEHDRAYFRGGTPEDRADADLALKRCMNRRGAPILGFVYWVAVRTMGHHFWPKVAKPEGWHWAGPVRRG